MSYTFLYWLPNYIHTKSHVNAEEAAFLSTVYDWGRIILLVFILVVLLNLLLLLNRKDLI